jgi:hypothetical protein
MEGQMEESVWSFQFSRKTMNTEPIFVIVQEGRVTEVKNIPPNATVQVIDKDVEFASVDSWKVSPVDGEACTIQTFGSI